MIHLPLSEAHAGQRLDKVLVTVLAQHAATSPLGRSGAKRLFDEGRVRLQRAGSERSSLARKGDVAAAGDQLVLDLPEMPAGADELAADPSVSFEVRLERADLLVVDKPAGVPTAPLRPGEVGTLANGLVARFPELAALFAEGRTRREAGLVNRLDTGTSGLLVVARTPEALEALTRALRDDAFDKRYLLLCSAADLPESGSVELPLAPHPKDQKRMLACAHDRDVVRYQPRPARTDYRVVRVAGDIAVVEARARRALRHQIRAHFAAIGHPLLGDALYGGDALSGVSAERHALHASEIGLDVSSAAKGAVRGFHVTSPLPDELARLVP